MILGTIWRWWVSMSSTLVWMMAKTLIGVASSILHPRRTPEHKSCGPAVLLPLSVSPQWYACWLLPAIARHFPRPALLGDVQLRLAAAAQRGGAARAVDRQRAGAR